MGLPSVVNATDTAVGYPELAFFKSDYFDIMVGAANKDLFANVQLWTSKRDKTVNMEYLFNLTSFDSEGNPIDPADSSLFNVQTLKTLCDLGLSTVDITEPDHKDDTIPFDSNWDALTARLLLTDNKQTYMIWLWLKYAIKFTGNREQDGGDAQVALLS